MKKCAIIGGLAVALASLAVLVPAGSAEVSVSRFPVSFSLFNPCTNEIVDFNGTARVADEKLAALTKADGSDWQA